MPTNEVRVCWGGGGGGGKGIAMFGGKN